MLEKDVVYYELEVGVRILDDDENWIDVTSRVQRGTHRLCLVCEYLAHSFGVKCKEL